MPKRKGSWEKNLIPNESRGLSGDLFGIAAIVGVGIVGFYFLKGQKGIDEGLNTLGKGAKNFVDAISSSGDWIADGSYWLQDKLGIGNTPGGRSEEDNIVRKIEKDVGATKSDIDRKKEKYASTWKPWADAVDSTRDFLGGLGCGVIRKC